MDESLQELENELKALQPRRASTLLRAKIEHDLGAPETAAPAPARARTRYTSATTLRSWKWAGWQAAASLAAVVAVAWVVWETQQAVPAAPEVEIEGTGSNRSIDPNGGRAIADASNVYRPVKASNVLYDVRDEGAVVLEDDTAARRVRARYVDTYTFKNPATNASLKLSVPRDEVRVLPASFH